MAARSIPLPRFRTSLGTNVLIGATLAGLVTSSVLVSRQQGNSNGNGSSGPLDGRNVELVPADPARYRRAVLVASENCDTDAYKRLRFQVVRNLNDPVLAKSDKASATPVRIESLAPLRGEAGPAVPQPYHFHIRGRLQAGESYPFGKNVASQFTPVATEDKTGKFEIIVKNVDVKNSESCAQYLATRKVGDTVEFRGPINSTPPTNNNHIQPAVVCLIVAGSGVTTAVQVLEDAARQPVAKRLPNDPAPTSYRLLWSTQTPSEFTALKKRLNKLNQQPNTVVAGNLSLRATLTRSAPNSWPDFRGRVNQDMLRELLPSPHEAAAQNMIVIVSGPKDFVQWVSGGEKDSSGQWKSKTPVGGLLGEMGYTLAEVQRM